MITLLLGQIPSPAPGSTESWLWSFAALVVIAAYVQQFVKGFKSQPPQKDLPQPVITKRAEEMVKAEEHKALAAKVEKLDARMDDLASEHTAQFQTLLEAGETRENRLRGEITRSNGNLHKRVDDILAAVSRLEGKMDHHS